MFSELWKDFQKTVGELLNKEVITNTSDYFWGLQVDTVCAAVKVFPDDPEPYYQNQLFKYAFVGATLGFILGIFLWIMLSCLISVIKCACNCEDLDYRRLYEEEKERRPIV